MQRNRLWDELRLSPETFFYLQEKKREWLSENPAAQWPAIAAETGEVCGKCGRSMDPDEPIFTGVDVSFRDYYGDWVYAKTNVCFACRPLSHPTEFIERRCEGCDRMVMRYHGERWRRIHTLCSERCRSLMQSRQVAKRRAEARKKTCAQCGESFTAARQDARFCSPACKQLAYRERRRLNAT